MVRRREHGNAVRVIFLEFFKRVEHVEASGCLAFACPAKVLQANTLLRPSRFVAVKSVLEWKTNLDISKTALAC